MATGTANPDYHGTLVASTVDTITIPAGYAAYKLITDGSARVDYTFDGTTPTVGGTATSRSLPAAGGAEIDDTFPVSYLNGTTFKIISSGTPKYDLEPALATDPAGG